MTADENNIPNDDYSEEEISNNRKSMKLIKHTEAVDRLIVQNKKLQKDLDEALDEIDYLDNRLKESSIKISKNLFYVGLLLAGYLLYTGNSHLNIVDNRLVEMNMIIEEYKSAIEKTELYNKIVLEKKLGILPETLK